MRLFIAKHDVGIWTAYYILQQIIQFKPTLSKPFVLGLPTGKTPLSLYKQLILFNQQKLLSFKHVVTFNIDEYSGLDKNNPDSYHYYMFNHFFKHIDIDPNNINLLNGTTHNIPQECNNFEKKITEIGGLKLLIAGCGRNGHIGFNEPGSSFQSTTRLVTLDESTILDNSGSKGHNLNHLPKQVLTMGIQTMMSAQQIILMTSGLVKAAVMAQVIEGPISHMCPASILQMHPNVIVVCDDSATADLKVKTVKYFSMQYDECNDIEKQISIT